MDTSTSSAPAARTRHVTVYWLLGILIGAPILAALVPLTSLLATGNPWFAATAFLLWTVPVGLVATFLVATAAALYERKTLRPAAEEGLLTAFFIPIAIISLVLG